MESVAASRNFLASDGRMAAHTGGVDRIVRACAFRRIDELGRPNACAWAQEFYIQCSTFMVHKARGQSGPLSRWICERGRVRNWNTHTHTPERKFVAKFAAHALRFWSARGRTFFEVHAAFPLGVRVWLHLDTMYSVQFFEVIEGNKLLYFFDDVFSCKKQSKSLVYKDRYLTETV